MAEVKLKNVTKSYGSTEVIPDLSLTVPEGAFAVLVGPSGCGKSTLLRLVAGLEDVTAGAVFIDDVDVTASEPSDRGIAMVFQSYALYPHMTVRENIGFGLRLAKTPKVEMNSRVEEAAEILQLTNYLDRKPKQLSGGQRQRVAIGRAIVRKPKVFLFDEPLSNLDANLRTQMRVELAELQKKLDTTMIYVTHDQVEAMTMADQIVILERGVLQQNGTPMEVYNKPQNPFVGSFIGTPKMNIIDGKAINDPKADLIGVRPENISLSKEKGLWRGRLRYAEHLGSDTIFYVETETLGQLVVRSLGEVEVNPGEEVFLTPDQGLIHRFSDGKRI